MKIKMIACMNNNACIGGNNKLLWHDKNDLKFFKRMTNNSAILMGRKTKESLGNLYPLVNRLNIVLTKTPILENEVSNISDAIELAKNNGYSGIWIIGGQTLYEQFLNITDELYLTSILDDQHGDSYFPYNDIQCYFDHGILIEEHGNTFMVKYSKK